MNHDTLQRLKHTAASMAQLCEELQKQIDNKVEAKENPWRCKKEEMGEELWAALVME